MSDGAIGRRVWAIAEGYIPEPAPGTEPPSRALESHETLCILNAGDAPAHVELTLYFGDRDPVGPYRVAVAARRTRHLRINDLQDPPVPRGADYSCVLVSDVPVVVQHTRLDSRQAALALLSTIAYSE